MTHTEASTRHQQLVREIRRHDHAYYVEARPTISDREYDLLYAELQALEKEFPAARGRRAHGEFRPYHT